MPVESHPQEDRNDSQRTRSILMFPTVQEERILYYYGEYQWLNEFRL